MSRYEAYMTIKSDETRIILDSIADGVFTVDSEWRISSFNRAAEHIIGISREEAIGQRCCDVFRASICESECALKKTVSTGEPIIDRVIYIIDLKGTRIPVSISTALLKDDKGEIIGGVETFRDLSTIAQLQQELHQRYTFEDIISKNKAMQKMFAIMPNIAESDAAVLIEGESGTGKELVARAIHHLSTRKDKPMVVVNCGALPDSLLESELFGYKAGAFTGANKDKPGRFAMADGGTLFLDEIGDVSPALQVRLLRFLQEHTYEPLGSMKTATADVRVIAASNKSLEQLVKEKSFREDLYYRINVVKVGLPPLRQRREDIPLLVDHFIRRFNRTRNKLISSVSGGVLNILMTHDYPGNIRELENIIEHAFVLCNNSVIKPEHLPANFITGEAASEQEAHTVQDFEKHLITETLRKNNWSRSKTAAEMGINASTLWRKMKKFGISARSMD